MMVFELDIKPYEILNSMFYCYLLTTENNQTYVGATTDPDRRL